MTHESMPNDAGLTTEQSLILRGFLATHIKDNETPQAIAMLDQASTETRDYIARFGLEISETKEYYAVMAGIVAGTHRMEMLIEMGLSPEIAGHVLRESFAGLYPNHPTA